MPACLKVRHFTRGINPANCLLLLPGIWAYWAIPETDFLRVQVSLLGAVILGALVLRLFMNSRPAQPDWIGTLRRWSRNGVVCCCLPALLSVTLRLLLLPWVPAPNPIVPDEYSHLLLAKTFLMGRLTNPPHPLWQHFETIHVLSQPTYSSMYMPGQACFLVVGKLLTGSFLGGVLLSTAMFCGALTWFLCGVVSPGWALFGGCLAAVRFGAACYWNNSYWGGSAAALGGALVLGGWVRLTTGWKIGPVLAFGAGAVLLANTRPYEGFGLVATLLIALAWNVVKHRRGTPWRLVGRSVALWLVLLGGVGWLMTREWKAVTGDPLTMPYVLNQRTYGWPLTLPFTKIHPVSLSHPELAIYRSFEIKEHEMISHPAGVLLKSANLWIFFFGAILSPVILFSGKILRTPRLRVIWVAGIIVGLQVFSEQSAYPHYISPATAVIVLFVIRGFQHLSNCRPFGIALGPAMVKFAIPMMLVMLGVRAAEYSPGTPIASKMMYQSWCCTDTRVRDRSPVVQHLMARPGKHLVLIEYDLSQYDTFDWIYNEPDIDHAKIVFASDMGTEKNQELLSYFADRRVWRLRVVGTRAYWLTDRGLKPILANPGRRTCGQTGHS